MIYYLGDKKHPCPGGIGLALNTRQFDWLLTGKRYKNEAKLFSKSHLYFPASEISILEQLKFIKKYPVKALLSIYVKIQILRTKVLGPTVILPFENFEYCQRQPNLATANGAKIVTYLLNEQRGHGIKQVLCFNSDPTTQIFA